jgi:hypothetical protein
MSEQQQAKSLYERLGGVYSIASVVDDFIDQIDNICKQCSRYNLLDRNITSLAFWGRSPAELDDH